MDAVVINVHAQSSSMLLDMSNGLFSVLLVDVFVCKQVRVRVRVKETTDPIFMKLCIRL